MDLHWPAAGEKEKLVACSGFLFRFLAVLVLHTAPILGNVSSATSWSRERKKASCDALHRDSRGRAHEREVKLLF